jgi:hypothetical protein
MLDEEDIWASMEELEDDRGVLEAESEIDAVLETVLVAGVLVPATLDEEAKSTELEDENADELWLTSDDGDESIELPIELEASVVGVTDEDAWILDENDETDELLSVVDAATELDEKDWLSDADADIVAEEEIWSTLLLDAAGEALELWMSDEATKLSEDDTSDEEDSRSDVDTGAGVADGQLPSKSLYVHVDDPESKETVWHVPEMNPRV